VRSAVSFGGRKWHGFVLALALMWTLVPIYWLVTTALKPNTEILSFPPTLLPKEWTLASFSFVLHHYAGYFANSVTVAFGSTMLSLIVGVMAAYGLSRFRFPRGLVTMIWLVVLSIRMMMPIVFIIPLYQIFQSIGLYNTRTGLILAYTLVNLPFVIWMMTSFFREIPKALDEAAMVDGASRWRVFFSVALPLAAPGIASVAILAMVMTWNDLVFGLFLSSDMQAMTLPVGIVGFITQYQTMWSEMAAAGSLAIVPVLAFTLFIQKYIVRGMTAGAVK
jgi:multiple sugar transport system permease protein